jgi:hypothetical protein
MDIVEVNDHSEIRGGANMFAYGAFELKVNGLYCRCPVTSTIGRKRDNFYDDFEEFIHTFDSEVRYELKTNSGIYPPDDDEVHRKVDGIIAFSQVSGGIVTNTVAKEVIQRMMRLDRHREPPKPIKDAARQACIVAKELGWDDLIPDEEKRHWYELE